MVNAIGSVHDPDSGQLIAGPRTEDNGMVSSMEALLSGDAHNIPGPGSNTTIGVVATNAKLTKAQASRLASSAHDGLALAVRPSHLIGDGDTMFALSTGDHFSGVRSSEEAQENFNRLIAATVRCTSLAIINGVKNAEGMHGVPSIGDL